MSTIIETSTPEKGASSEDSGAQQQSGNALRSGRLGIPSIVFFVVSAAAPLTVVASAGPMSFRVGGIGGPGAMLFCGLVLMLFASGFTAMSRYVKNAGAFYAYVSRGFGKVTGIGVSFLTLLAYAMLTVSFYGFIGFFASNVVAQYLGMNIPWWVWSLAAAAIVAFLGYRKIDVGAKVLGVLLTAEVTILLLLSVAVLVKGGPEPISFASFSPHEVFLRPGSGALFVFGFGAYIGFEGTAIYAEEAKNPKRTVPWATVIAIAFLVAFYSFTFWMLTVAFGSDSILAVAQGKDFTNMVFAAGDQYLGHWAGVTMNFLIITSFFACVLAFHNDSSRYVFAMAREGLLPRKAAVTQRKHGSPYVASFAISAISIVAILVAMATHADPYMQLAIWTYSPGVAALVLAQAIAALSVLAFFIRDRRGFSAWRVLVAPALGAAGLAVGFFLIVRNFDMVTGLSGAINTILLIPVPIMLAIGLVYGLWMKLRRPEHYAQLNTYGASE
ncbi:MAG: APC family permease [Bifidobacterium tibiigranuli]|uniref:APC family permease n=1 Tax=Bifidobacterium tibiigranuli TaxID=2172043 RepID=UPI0026EABCD9|nr:APC family permease [Bifidobacterium tibiigranuli]MCI1672951.1 APC family permease [Bifidobacterium tibiigranuli]MCI1714091.1 APC family permease [Bifidobacterium tibiigranuli]MCI1835021.1 APC family permease [Bifidobacterium tibiigranuli]